MAPSYPATARAPGPGRPGPAPREVELHRRHRGRARVTPAPRRWAARARSISSEHPGPPASPPARPPPVWIASARDRSRGSRAARGPGRGRAGQGQQLGEVPHSACQAPAARSCSCSISASTVATSPGTRLAQDSTETAATGLRLLAIAVEPPRPGSPLLYLADFLLGEQGHVARDLGHHPGRMPQRDRRASRVGPGSRPTVGRAPRGPARLPLSAMTGARAPTGPPICTASSSRSDLIEPVGGRIEPREPAGRPQPEWNLERLLEHGPPGHRRAAMRLRQRGATARRRLRVGEDRRQRSAGHEHQRGVEDVLAGRPAMHCPRVGSPTASRRAATSGTTGVAWRRLRR